MKENANPGSALGRAMLQRIGGDLWESGIRPLADVSPDMARITMDFAYGEILSRTGLDLVERQSCTVAMLLANGSATAQLKFHLHGLLNVGGTVAQAIELLTIGTAMAGFPAAIGSVGALRAVLSERELTYQPSQEPTTSDRWSRGLTNMRELAGCGSETYTMAFREFAPEFADLTVSFEFGEVLGRPGLVDDTRHLVVIAMLAASGNRQELLDRHIAGALASGISRDRIAEVFIQLAVYAGFPTALNAFAVLRQAQPAQPAELDTLPVASEGHDTDRRRRGLATLEATSKGSGAAVVSSFADIAPHIGAMIVDHAYAEIFADPRLDPKLRELAAVATLASTMAEVDVGPLGVHIAAARSLGATREEIVQVIVNTAAYSGYPAAQKALMVAAGSLAAATKSQ